MVKNYANEATPYVEEVKKKVDTSESHMSLKNTLLGLNDLINSMLQMSKMIRNYAEEVAYHVENIQKKIVESSSISNAEG